MRTGVCGRPRWRLAGQANLAWAETAAASPGAVPAVQPPRPARTPGCNAGRPSLAWRAESGVGQPLQPAEPGKNARAEVVAGVAAGRQSFPRLG